MRYTSIEMREIVEGHAAERDFLDYPRWRYLMNLINCSETISWNQWKQQNF